MRRSIQLTAISIALITALTSTGGAQAQSRVRVDFIPADQRDDPASMLESQKPDQHLRLTARRDGDDALEKEAERVVASMVVRGDGALVLTGWYVVQAASRRTAAGIPGPIGGPDVAVDVNTMIGKKSPSFRLRDGEGRAYTVTPAKGRPLVVISHMGYH